MTNYVPGSLTEVVIGCGAQEQPLDPELREIAGIVLAESARLDQLPDAEIRRYMLEGAGLVREVLERK